MSDTVEAGEKQFEEAITSGRALKRLQKMFIQQGVSAEMAEALCRFEAFPEYDPAYEKFSIKRLLKPLKIILNVLIQNGQRKGRGLCNAESS